MKRTYIFKLLFAILALASARMVNGQGQYCIGSSTRNEAANCVRVLKNNAGTIIGGCSYDRVLGSIVNSKALLMNVNPSGTGILWQEEFSLPSGNSTIEDMVITHDGNIVVVGYLGRPAESYGSYAFIMKVRSSDGGVLWQKSLRDVGFTPGGEVFHGVAELGAAGNYELVAVGCHDLRSYYNKSMVCVFEEDGDFIYEEEFKVPWGGSDGSDEYTGVCTAADGASVYMCGYFRSNYADVRVQAYTPHTSATGGTSLWSRYMDFTLPGVSVSGGVPSAGSLYMQSNFCNHVELAGDQVLISGGSLSSFTTTGGNGQSIIRLNADGSGSPVLWELQNSNKTYVNQCKFAAFDADHIYNVQMPTSAWTDPLQPGASANSNVVITDVTSLAGTGTTSGGHAILGATMKMTTPAHSGVHSLSDITLDLSHTALELAGTTNDPDAFGMNDIYYVKTPQNLPSYSCDSADIGGAIPVPITVFTPATYNQSFTPEFVSVDPVITTYSIKTLCEAGTTPTIDGTLSICVGVTSSLTSSASGGVWSSSNPTIASISSAGVVTGIYPGTVTINYDVSGTIVTAVVSVNAYPANILGATFAVCEGAAITLTNATAGGAWSTSNSNASVSGGVVTGVSADTSVVSYTSAAGCAKTAIVTVNQSPAAIGGSMAACIGTTTSLSNTVTGGVWSSTATSIVSVAGGTGVVTALAAGTANITYTLAGSCRRIAAFTVNAFPSAITGTLKACPGTATTLADATSGGTWASSNTAIAAVGSSTGIVTGVDVGVVTISYISGAGCYKTALVTINPNPGAIAGILGTCVGTTTILSNATPGGLSWTSSTTSVATVGATSGIVTGVTPGTTNITYTLGTGCTTSSVVTIYAAPATIGGTPKTCVGSTTTLTDGVSGGSWSSSNTAIASVGSSFGVVSGVAAGTAVISYATSPVCYKTIVVTVSATPGAISGSLTACLGTTTTLSNTPSGGTWASSTTSVATVTAAGIVTGVAAGTSTITYTISGCSATAVVTVSGAPPTSTGPSSVCVGSTITLSNSSPGGTWSSSNTSVLTVAATGVVTGVGAATANVTYSFGGTCRTVSPITVKAIPGAITGTTSVCVGAATTLTNSSGPGTWSSSNTAVGTIGSISAVAGRYAGIAAGVSLVSYTFTNGCARTVAVTVNPSPVAGTISSSGGFVINTSSAPTSVTLSSSGTAGGAWSSSSTAVATITSGGVVNSVAGGTTNISYQVTLGSCSALATHTLTVLVARPGAVGSSPEVQLPTSINLYPNPNSGQFTITGTMASAETGTAYIEVTNMLGQVIFKANATVDNHSVNQVISLGDALTDGMYLLSVMAGDERATLHFVLKH